MANVEEQMREDWNRRAREDAHYYVAFGRHGQDDEEFFETAKEIVYGLEFELKRMGGNPRSRRALEIGCGPGRIMRPLSRNFGEIHGVDVSDEMVQRAQRNLRGIRHAHVHVSPGAELPQFADESFDFIYSYAVFQHIPSKDVVRSYLREAHRLLKVGGQLWFQVNSLPRPVTEEVNTWSGVRFTQQEICDYANAHDFQMFILEGVQTQYMWTSLRKRPSGWFRDLPSQKPPTAARIKAISNPHSTEPAVPAAGRFAVASLWVEDLHPEAGLNHMRVRVADRWSTPNYIAARRPDGLQQINAPLPEGLPTGLLEVRLEWLGEFVGPAAIMRVIPPGPRVPRLILVSDATDVMAGTRIVSGSVRVCFHELLDARDALMSVDGQPVGDVVVHCADPKPPQLELVFALPPRTEPGHHVLEIQVGKRRFPPVALEVASAQ